MTNEPALHPLEAILRHCAAARPEPWYPSAYAREAGIDRDSLDPYLDQLRLAGLIQIADWAQGKGQGYTLTPAGAEVVEDPRQLGRVRDGDVPRAPPSPVPSFHEPGDAARRRTEAIQDVVARRSAPGVTLVLIAVNVLVFLAGLGLAQQKGQAEAYLAGGFSELAARFAVRRFEIFAHHEWWRLLTACFVHFGFIHLAVNMYSLYVVGPLLERIWGHWQFLALYLIAGVGGSCAMLFFDPPNSQGGAGASGAIWGVLASMVTWLVLNRGVLADASIAYWRRQLVFVFILNVFITFSIPGISKGAHFGGGVVGLLTALPLDVLRFGRPAARGLAALVLVAIPTACVGAVVARGELERREITDFDQNYLPRISAATAAADEAFRREAEPLLETSPDDRGPGRVKRAVEDLARVRNELAEVSQLLGRAGPFVNFVVEQARQRGKTYVEAETRLIDRAADFLKRGAALTPENQRVLDEHKKEVRDALARWDELLEKKE